MNHKIAKAKKSQLIHRILLGSWASLSLTIFANILIFSTPAVSIEEKIAQQSEDNTQNPTDAAAEKLLQEGMQLYQEGTAESLRGPQKTKH